MLKLKIWGETPKDEVVLRLVRTGDEIVVMAVDGQGKRRERGCIGTFTEDGRLSRNHDVNPEFGFQRDGYGRIVVK